MTTRKKVPGNERPEFLAYHTARQEIEKEADGFSSRKNPILALKKLVFV